MGEVEILEGKKREKPKLIECWSLVLIGLKSVSR
jgi:hypothetical protein